MEGGEKGGKSTEFIRGKICVDSGVRLDRPLFDSCSFTIACCGNHREPMFISETDWILSNCILLP